MKMKKSEIEAKRKEIVALLLQKGWKPNLEYIIKNYSWFHNPPKINYETGEVGGIGGTYNYGQFIISSDGTMAATIKSTVIILHDSKRSYCKVFSAKYADLEIKKDGLQHSKIKIMF